MHVGLQLAKLCARRQARSIACRTVDKFGQTDVVDFEGASTAKANSDVGIVGGFDDQVT